MVNVEMRLVARKSCSCNVGEHRESTLDLLSLYEVGIFPLIDSKALAIKDLWELFFA